MSTNTKTTDGSVAEPNFYAPYPDEIEQVIEPRTEGEAEVVELIKDEWPCDINHLEEEAEERDLGRDGEGFSGSFIRSVLRSYFARASEVEEEEEAEEEVESEMEIDEEFEIGDSEEEWEKAYRQGIKVALTTSLSEEAARESFTDGFVEGRKVKAEMEVESLKL